MPRVLTLLFCDSAERGGQQGEDAQRLHHRLLCIAAKKKRHQSIVDKSARQYSEEQYAPTMQIYR